MLSRRVPLPTEFMQSASRSQFLLRGSPRGTFVGWGGVVVGCLESVGRRGHYHGSFLMPGLGVVLSERFFYVE